MRIAGWIPRASSRSSSSAGGELGRSARELAARPRRISFDQGVQEPQAQGERHEPLLGSIVEVALQTPPLDVARLDDPRPRGGEALVGVGVGQRLGDQVREVAELLLGVASEVLGRVGGGHQGAPELAGDAHRGRDRGPQPASTPVLGDHPVGGRVLVNSLSLAVAPDPGHDRPVVERQARADREGAVAPARPSCRREPPRRSLS